MSAAIFIKSYPGDYRWLNYCLRSIQRFATGFSEVVVALPTGQGLPLTKERIVFVNEWKMPAKPGAPSPGYYHQMFVKLNADVYCPDADYIILIDSDCIFDRPFDVSEMFKDGKPMLLRRRWDEAGKGIIWREAAEHALGFTATHDTMCCHPSIYRREDFGRARRHIERIHRMPLEAYVQSRDRFIEFVTIGNFILKTCPEAYHVVDQCKGDEYPRPLVQNWSWGGINPQKARELEDLLS